MRVSTLWLNKLTPEYNDVLTTFILRPGRISLPVQGHPSMRAGARRGASCKSRIEMYVILCICQNVACRSHTRVNVCELRARMCVPSGHPHSGFRWHHTRCFHLRHLLSGERRKPGRRHTEKSIVEKYPDMPLCMCITTLMTLSEGTYIRLRRRE
jgi:hypothetical protein